MKRFVTFIAGIACMALLLNGCVRPADDPTGVTTDPTANVGATTQDTTQSTKPPSVFTQGTPLTAEELKWFEEEYFSNWWEGDKLNIRNMFLAQYFSSPEEIDLWQLFREGIYRREFASQEEIIAIDEITDIGLSANCYKIPKQEMESAFLENTGLAIEQTQKNGLDKLYFLEEYNAYYFPTLGEYSNYNRYVMIRGVRLDDGTIVLQYKGRHIKTVQREVTLVPSGRSSEINYLFVSNQPATESVSMADIQVPDTYFNQGTPLTEEEIKWFNDEFFSSGQEFQDNKVILNIRNMFLRVKFTSVKEIDMRTLFREGVGQVEHATQEETVAVYKMMFDDWTEEDGCPIDVFRISRQAMEDAFLENTGLTIDQTEKRGLDRLYYLKQYDAYYDCHSDTAYNLYQIKEGVRLDDGTVVLIYQSKIASTNSEADFAVTLKPHEDTYWFVSNMVA